MVISYSSLFYKLIYSEKKRSRKLPKLLSEGKKFNHSCFQTSAE